MKIFLVDNFDLYTNNLIEEFEKLDCEVLSYRSNVDMNVMDSTIKKFKPKLIVISSGPGNVSNAGNSVDIILNYAGKIPVFGVGLGHQCIIEAFGGKIGKSALILHGKTATISHDQKTIYKRLDKTFVAGRYNSLTGTDISYTLEVSARDENDAVMGVRHKDCFVEGIQFHPESILTPKGSLFIESLLKEVEKK